MVLSNLARQGRGGLAAVRTVVGAGLGSGLILKLKGKEKIQKKGCRIPQGKVQEKDQKKFCSESHKPLALLTRENWRSV